MEEVYLGVGKGVKGGDADTVATVKADSLVFDRPRVLKASVLSCSSW